MAAPIQILGAGLTGMSAAHHLGSDCEIHERLSGPGGHAITRQKDGYRFDRTGHLLHLRDDGIRAWVTGLLGDDSVQVQRNSRVFSHGVYTRYPYQANTFGLPPEVANECILGFLQALKAQPWGSSNRWATRCTAPYPRKPTCRSESGVVGR